MTEEAGSVEAGNPVESPSVSAVPGTVSQQETQSSWIEGVQDPSIRSWAETKGLQNGSFENVLGSYHNLEKMVGAEKAGRTITLLGDDAPPEAVNEFYTKLGRPETPDKYSVQAPDGADNTRLDMMRNMAHELGLSDKQFAGLAEADAQYIDTVTQEVSSKNEMSAVEAEAQLRKDWGAAYDLKAAQIDIAASKLGFTDEHLSGLRSAMGPVEALKFVDGLNSKMGDHDFDNGEVMQPGHLTPDQAGTELSELSMNKEFMDAWLDRQHPGHKAAVEKKSRLARLSSGVA